MVWYYSQPENQKGFTLIEVLVAVGISLLLVASIVGLLLFSLKSNKIIWEQLETQNEGRQVTQDFTNELRTASASSVGAYPVVSAGPREIIFYSNIDPDPPRERVRYFLDGAILRKGIIKPAGNPLQYNPASEVITPVAHDVANGANPIFYYYSQDYAGGNGNPLPAPVDITQVRAVKISLDLEEDPQVSPAPFHIETKAEIRNLKTN